MQPTSDERREVAERLRDDNYGYETEYGFLIRALGMSRDGRGPCDWSKVHERLADLIEPQPIDGNTSDGYHTFNELYHHRAVLFSVIVENFAARAWKSKLHADGTMYDGMFIVGIETPDGQATYHYDIDPYWDLFRCKEVDRAPEWDGHTPDQAIERIGKLVDCKTDRPTCRNIGDDYMFKCSECGADFEPVIVNGNECGEVFYIPLKPLYCSACGAEVASDDE